MFCNETIRISNTFPHVNPSKNTFIIQTSLQCYFRTKHYSIQPRTHRHDYFDNFVCIIVSNQGPWRSGHTNYRTEWERRHLKQSWEAVCDCLITNHFYQSPSNTHIMYLSHYPGRVFSAYHNLRGTLEEVPGPEASVLALCNVRGSHFHWNLSHMTSHMTIWLCIPFFENLKKSHKMELAKEHLG